MANIGINITNNGTTTLATAGKYCDRNIDVNVGVESGPAVIQALEVTTNGTYNAPEGVDGYAPVTVNVPQDGAPTAQELTFSESCTYKFCNNGWNWFLNKYHNLIKFKGVSDLRYALYETNALEDFGFDIEGPGSNSYIEVTLLSMFGSATQLKVLPRLKNMKIGALQRCFSHCFSLREIPDSFFGDCEFGRDATDGVLNGIFYRCYSLRKLPEKILRLHDNASPTIDSGFAFYHNLSVLLTLDEAVDLPVYAQLSTGWTNNIFANFSDSFGRVNRITFKTQEDGTPYAVKWAKQSMDFTSYVGWVYPSYKSAVYSYNSGITEDKEVTDDASYQALKNDPDWWTINLDYSRYNHDSAVETINSLPDTTAYLAEKGGTNNIKFKGAAGSKTDGGAINTLTEAEIAVAAAKGWTVSLA